MQVAVSGRHVALTQGLVTHVRGRLSKLDRYFPRRGAVAHAVLSVEHHAHTVEISVMSGDVTLRAEGSAPNMYTAVDAVVHKLVRQLHRRNKLAHRKQRRPDPGAEPVPRLRVATPGAEAGRRTGGATARIGRRTLPSPADIDPATLGLHLLEHGTFAFCDGSSGQVCIVHRRRPGGYGAAWLPRRKAARIAHRYRLGRSVPTS